MQKRATDSKIRLLIITAPVVLNASSRIFASGSILLPTGHDDQRDVIMSNALERGVIRMQQVNMD